VPYASLRSAVAKPDAASFSAAVTAAEKEAASGLATVKLTLG